MADLKSGAWWRAAFFRALRTALVIAVPYAPTVIYDGAWGILLSTAGFGALTSLVTSLWGIAETEGVKVHPFWAIFERVVKTAAQSLLTAFGTATMFSEVTWAEVPALVGSAVLGSLLLAVLKQLPESDIPLAQATVAQTTVNVQTGQTETTAVPVIAVAPAPQETVDTITAEAPEFVPEDVMDAPPRHSTEEPPV